MASLLPRATLLVFACLLHRARVNGDQGQAEVFTKNVGDSVTFPLTIPDKATFTELFWRTTEQRQAVAIWTVTQSFSVLDARYSGRVTFSEDTLSLEIKNLKLADGEIYEMSMVTGQSEEKVIKRCLLFVFDVTGEGEKFANGSCSLDLECQAGAGPTASVTYSWKDTKTGAPLAQSSRLHEFLPPQDKERSFTCTAKAYDTQGVRAVVPYGEFCNSGERAAGLFLPGLLPYHYVTEAALLPALVAVLLLP